MHPILSNLTRNCQRFFHAQQGFSLIETAIVLAIMATLIGFGLPLLSRLQMTQKHNACLKNIELSQQILNQYFHYYNRLPCPASEDDPTLAGVAPPDCPHAASWSGSLPYRTLGLPRSQALDSQGQVLRYHIDPHYTSAEGRKMPPTQGDHRILVLTSDNQPVVVHDKNPIIYILQANNTSQFKAELSSGQRVFHEPSTVVDTTQFPYKLVWIAVDTVTAPYSQNALTHHNHADKDNPKMRIPPSEHAVDSISDMNDSPALKADLPLDNISQQDDRNFDE